MAFVIDPTPKRVLCLSAHADDVEIGGGALVARLARNGANVLFVVMTGDETRWSEAKASAADLCGKPTEVVCLDHRDGHLPYDRPGEAKDQLRAATDGFRPDLVLAPNLGDAHQDHRFLAEMAHQLYRETPIFEYEIPKYEADPPTPNVFVPLDPGEVESKLAHLDGHFPSQQHRGWYGRAVFAGVMALRGVQCNTPSAEAFVCRTVTLR